MPREFGVSEQALPRELRIKKRPEPLAWSYVWNPKERNARAEPVGEARLTRAADFEEFFRREGIQTLVKARSVVHALRHFEEMPDEIRRMLPAEHAAGKRWAKLKRGPLRILVHVRGPGQAEFHLYARREWSHPIGM